LRFTPISVGRKPRKGRPFKPAAPTVFDRKNNFLSFRAAACCAPTHNGYFDENWATSSFMPGPMVDEIATLFM